jgi:hypothetical protein
MTVSKRGHLTGHLSDGCIARAVVRDEGENHRERKALPVASP